MVAPMNFGLSPLMSVDTTNAILLSPWCAAASRQDHGNP